MGTPSNTPQGLTLAENYDFLPTNLAATQIRDKRQSINSYHVLTSLSLAYIQILNEILRWAHPQIPPQGPPLIKKSS